MSFFKWQVMFDLSRLIFEISSLTSSNEVSKAFAGLTWWFPVRFDVGGITESLLSFPYLAPFEYLFSRACNLYILGSDLQCMFSSSSVFLPLSENQKKLEESIIAMFWLISLVFMLMKVIASLNRVSCPPPPSPRIIESHGNQAKFASFPSKILCAKFDAFFRSPAILP